jgi:hypothetical protein
VCKRCTRKFRFPSFFVPTTEPPTALFGRSSADDIDRSIADIRRDIRAPHCPSWRPVCLVIALSNPCATFRSMPSMCHIERVVLSRIASKMGCKSCGEFAMARSTSEMAACCSTSSVTRSSGSEAVLFPWILPPLSGKNIKVWHGHQINRRPIWLNLHSGRRSDTPPFAGDGHRRPIRPPARSKRLR